MAVTFSVLVLFCTTGFSQPVTAQHNAKTYIKKLSALIEKSQTAELDQEELLNAINYSNDIIQDDNYSSSSRAFYLRGMAFKNAYLSQKSFNPWTQQQFIEESAKSFQKAISLNALNATQDFYQLSAIQENNSFWAVLFKIAETNYHGNDLEKATLIFEHSALLKPNDTTSFLYAATAATESESYERAFNNLQEVLRVYPPHKTANIAIVSIAMNHLKDMETTAILLDRAKLYLNNNFEIQALELDFFISTKQYEKALELIDRLILMQPRNPNLFLRKGMLMDTMAASKENNADGNTTLINQYIIEAIKAYEKTIELDISMAAPYFNLSVIYNSRANFHFTKANKLSIDEYNARGKSIEEKGLAQLRQATDLMEKVHLLEPENTDALLALQNFYTKLGQQDKLLAVQQKLKDLGF